MLILWKGYQRDPLPGLGPHLPHPDGGGARHLRRPGHQGGDQRRRAQPVRPGRPGARPGRPARACPCRWPTWRATTSSPVWPSWPGTATRSPTSTPASPWPRRPARWSRPTPTSGPGPSSRPSTAGPTWSSAPGSPTPRWWWARRPGTTAGARPTGTGWPARWWPATSSSAAPRPPGATTPSSPRSPASSTRASPSPRWPRTARRSSPSTRAPAARCRSGTVTAQLLYEIAGPDYPNTDVVARFDTIAVDQEGPDRVRIIGAPAACPHPTEVKVCLNLLGGWRNSMTFVLTGLDIEEKAALTLRSLEPALGGRGLRPVRRVRRPAHPLGQGRRRGQRGGHRPAADHGEGRRPREGGPELLRRRHRAGPGRLPGPPPHRTPGGGHRLRRLLAGAGPGRPGGPRGASTPTAAGSRCPTPPTWPGRRAVREPWTPHPTWPCPRRRRWPRPARPEPARPPGVDAGPTRRLPLGHPHRGPLGGQGGQRQRRAVGPHGRRLGVARRRSSPSSGSGTCCPRPTASRSGASPSPTCRPSTSWWSGLLGEGVASSTRPDPQAKGLGEYLRSRSGRHPGRPA